MEGFQHSRRPLWQQARIGPPGQSAFLSREIREGMLRQPGQDSRSLASGCKAGVQNHFCRETGSTVVVTIPGVACVFIMCPGLSPLFLPFGLYRTIGLAVLPIFQMRRLSLRDIWVIGPESHS